MASLHRASFHERVGRRLAPRSAFRQYLIQDYLFLIEFARAYALSVYKAVRLADMREAAAGLSAILDVEMNLHVKLSAGWGLGPSDLEQAPPAVEMLAYTRYVLDTGMRGDLLALQVALAPCVIGYAEIATRLARDPMRSPQRIRIASGSKSMPVRPTSRLRRKRGRSWSVSPISTPHLPARQSWSRSSGKLPGSRPTSGKWAGVQADGANTQETVFSSRSPDERSDIRGPSRGSPAYRCAHAGYALKSSLRQIALFSKMIGKQLLDQRGERAVIVDCSFFRSRFE